MLFSFHLCIRHEAHTSVACAIGPSVNTFFYFSHFQNWKFLISMMWTHTFGAQLIFLPNPNFAICLNFQQQNPLKNQYLPYISSDNCGINSIESDLPRAFQQHQKCPQIPIQFSVWILFSFHWENGSIINSFDTVAPNSLKPSQCTPTHQELSKDNENTVWSAVVWEISEWQNKLPWFIDRCIWYLQIVFLYFRYGFDGQDPVHVSWNEMHVCVKILTSFFPRIATSTHQVSRKFF